MQGWCVDSRAKSVSVAVALGLLVTAACQVGPADAAEGWGERGKGGVQGGYERVNQKQRRFKKRLEEVEEVNECGGKARRVCLWSGRVWAVAADATAQPAQTLFRQLTHRTRSLSIPKVN